MYILVFEHTKTAIRAEKTLLHKGCPVRVLPLPETVRGGCGIALKVADYALAVALLKNEKLAVQSVYATEDGETYAEVAF